MIRYMKKVALAVLLAALVVGAYAIAENIISTSVVMRVSKTTQSAVVNVGEDLSMEINVDGVVPTAYQWYKDGQAISGADQKVYTIVDAEVADSGVYRMDAFDEDGRMLVSMDISARVIDPNVPKSGDDSMPIGVAAGLFAAAAGALLVVFRRRRRA